MLQPHQRLGEFEILRLLGRGGMGEVYEAQQDRPNRRVALKVLAPWLAQNEQFLKRFWREAEIPAQLDHPGIVRIISTGQTDGIAYYTMHLVQGISLADLIRQDRDFNPQALTSPDGLAKTPTMDVSLTPPGEVSELFLSAGHLPQLLRSYREDRYAVLARLGSMVARALSHAHSKGCVHRDLKPANIMVDQHGQAYLMDFGLTRALAQDGVASQPGLVMGTPWYMSPEQARGESIDHRSDIYSLGVTLYELATRGNGPYASAREEASTVLAQVRTGQYLPIRSQDPGIPVELESIILKAMHYRANRRYADAAQIAADLERFLTMGTAARRVATAGTAYRRKLLLGAAALLSIAAVLILCFWPPSPADSGGTANRDNGTHSSGDSAAPPRDRPWGIPQSLFNIDHRPLWERRLAGNGTYQHSRLQLILTSRTEDDHPTLLALDDDPLRRWYEFSIELNAPLQERNVNRIGVFFGWRKDSDRFFFVEIDEHEMGIWQHGMARIGVMRLVPRAGAAAPINEIAWMQGEKGELGLTKSKAWHKLVVRVVDDRIQVSVDGSPPIGFTMGWFDENQRGLGSAVDCRGALGVWTWNCLFGAFRNGTITALQGEKE